MSSAHSHPFKVLWITLQMVLVLIGPHPESASPHLHPYVSEFRYVPQYHPSRNPDCASHWLRREFYNERFGYGDRRHSSFREPLVDRDRPSIEIRAVLVRCSKTRKETETSQSLRNCRRKVIISMKINNVGKTNTREEFVLVDHVLDPIKMHKIRLRNPYVIKVRQEPLLHLYGLRLQGIVNAEAREEVINNHRANFTGCNDGLNNPTCGQMFVNEESIPFSQGFCCSCEDAKRAESFRSVAAKSNYYQRDDGANRTRNRSVSRANLFDNSGARRQIEANEKVEDDRQVGSDARERATSRDTSAVNGPLGERASPLREQQREGQLRNNSARPLEGSPRAENANRTESRLPFALQNVFSDPSPSKGKIEAYIDAVYEQAMKERATEHESDKISKDSLDGNDLFAGSFRDSRDKLRESGRRISDGRSSTCEAVTDSPPNITKKFTNTADYDCGKLKPQEFGSRHLDCRSRSRIRGSDEPRNPTTKLTRLDGERGITKTGGEGDNREFLEPEKWAVNFPESGSRGETARDRFRGAARPESTYDYTPTSSPRVPEGSRSSRRTERNLLNGDNTSLDNGSFPATTESFIRSGISSGSDIDEDINYDSATMKSNSFEENVFALLSKIMMSETRSSTAGGERQDGFRTSENTSDNVNALRNASVVRENSSVAAIRRGNTSDVGEGKTENANVSTRISTAPAFTRLRDLSSPVGISRLEELSAVAARPGDKSLARILESKTRGSLPANEIQGYPDDLGDLYGGRESRGMHNSPERAPKGANLKKSLYKFWKPRRKLRKSKVAEKFRGDEGAGGESRRFGRSARGSTRKRALLMDSKPDSFPNKFSERERRFRRHLQTGKDIGKELSNIADARSNGLTDKGSRNETQALTDHYTRAEVTQSKREASNASRNENPKKQVILESGHSHREVQPEENDDSFYFGNKDGKKNSVDKRIEDKFARISNVLKEDSTETGIIQETPGNFEVVTKSEVVRTNIPKIRDELGDNLLSRENGKSSELFAIHDEITREQSAKLNDTRRRLIVNENALATTGFTMTGHHEVTTITSLITRKDSTDHRESVILKPVIDPFPSSSTRNLDCNVARKIDFNKSQSPIYAIEFVTKRTEIFTQELPSVTPRGENGYVTDGLGTSSNNWASDSREVTETLNNRSEGERGEMENARFLEINDSSQTAGNFARPEGPLISPVFSSYGSASITEPGEIRLSDEEGISSRYTEDPLLEDSESFLEGPREKEEIAKLVDRIVRQYAAYTPIMPGMPTFDEITEAETLPLEEETTVAQLTTTTISATTTRITDVAFRPSVRRLKTTPPPGEMHDEISLDETTFVDETEAPTTIRERAVSKPRFRPGRLGHTSPKAKVRKTANKKGQKKGGKRKGKQRQKIVDPVTMKTTEETGDHPWYQATEVQQIIAANRSKPVQKTLTEEERRKKHRSEINYPRNASSARTSSSATTPSGVAPMRANHDHESEDEEARRGGRRKLNKNERSSNVTESTELRSAIEKRLAELNYPASRGFSRRGCESRDQAQKLSGALHDVAARNVELRTVEDNLDSDPQEKEEDTRGSLKNFTLLKRALKRHVRDDAAREFDKDISSREMKLHHEATSVYYPLPSGPAKISSSRTDLSGSARGRLEMDRTSGKRASGERTVAEIGRVAMVRKIAVNVSEYARTANDLSARDAEKSSSAGEILPIRARSPGDRDEKRETVVRGAKSMTPDDKGELDVAVKSTDKRIPPLSAARRRGREDATKINEDPADCRVPGKRYLRRPRGKVYGTVRKIINRIEGKLSSVSDEADRDERDPVGSEKRIARSSPSDWHRSGRRLLSSGGSGYIESTDDEYHANDESETDRESVPSDNEAVTKRDLSYLKDRSGRRKDRDSRKLAKTDRLAKENTDISFRVVTPEKRVCDAAMVSDDMQANSEEAISGNYRNIEEKVKNKNTDFQDIEIGPESTDLASFNDDKTLEVPLEAEEKSIVQRAADNNSSVQEEDILRNSRAYKEIREKPFSYREKIDENNSFDEIRDESLYETQPTFNMEETVNPSAMNNQDLSSPGRVLSNIDSSQGSTTPKNDGSIKISLIGRIQVHGGLNQTPMLISFDAIPDGSSISTGLSSTIQAIETTINLSLNDSNTGSTCDPLSTGERARDEASDSLNAISDESREAEEAGGVRTKSREKLFDLTRRSGEVRKTAKKGPSRIEKRLDKHNTNPRPTKQVFLTDYSDESNGEVDGTNAGRTISDERTIGKLDSPRSFANPVYFPDILGSVLINNDSLKDREVIEEPSNTTLHIVPLMHISTEKPSIDLANDGNTRTTCCPCAEDLQNATTFGGCYRMPTTVRKLEIASETTSRESQTSSGHRYGDSTEPLPPRFHETTVNDRNVVTVRPSTSIRLRNETAAKNETRSTATPSSKCHDDSVNAIRVRNMMAVVRFMMKLLRIVAEEEPPCPRTQIGETVIHVKNVIIDGGHVELQKSTTDRITKSERTRQDFTEWRSTIAESIREDSSPSSDRTFESFTEAPSHLAASTLPTTTDEAPKDEGLSTLFETATGKEERTFTLSSATSFLFYEPARKSPRKDASRKNTRVDLTGVRQNSNVSFESSKDDAGKGKFRLDGSRTNRSPSWPRDQDRGPADRLHLRRQGIASATNPEDKIGSGSTDSVNVAIRPILPRDVSRDALLEGIGTARENRPGRSKPKTARKTARVLDRRRAETRTKLLNRSTRGGPPPGDWIGKHRTVTQRAPPIDKNLRESRRVPGGTATPGKVVFRRVRGKINRPPDPNLVSGRSDSFKIEGNVAGNGPLAKLSTGDTLSIVGGELGSLKREDAPGNAIRYSTPSLMSDNVGASRIGRVVADEHISIPYEKRDVSERRDFRKGNRVLGKRQKASSPTKRRKTKQRKKKKKKKGSQRTRYISGTENQLQRFKRRLLMTSLEYDADDAAAGFSGRHVASGSRRNAERFRMSAGSDAEARRRRRRDGSRTVDGSESDPGTAQIRGGQDCADRRHPPNIDAARYLESAHCLRFSDLWYSVYQLEDPIVEHTVYLQVYEKRALANGSTYWEDLTGDSVVRLGTFNRHHRDSQDTIAFAYKEVKMLEREGDEVPNLDVVRDRLLVPSSVTSKGSEYLVEDKSGEYLVVPASSINESGNECDKAGVGFAAFARQPDRCGRARGTCLKNQPLAYRRRDAEARAAGRPGCYFLSNFASVPSEPIKYSGNGSGSHEFLALEYHSPHVSAIDIEVKADYNAALAGGPSGRISEVHVDGTALDHTIVSIVISNMGLTSMSYRSRITKCPDNLPESWVNATFPTKMIQARRDQTVSLDLYGELPIKEFHCSVQLLNRFGRLVATRRIKIRKMDRCSCMLYCLCECVSDASGTCRPMSPELYHAAGFRGPVPTASREIFIKIVDALLFIVSSILLLLFMGFLKWLIGLYIPVVGRWGLDSLLETGGMSEYFERELKCKCVMTNEHGAPVHPDTRKRTVRICSRKAEFFLNTMFFLIFPFAICCLRLKKSFRRPAQCCRSGESKNSMTSDKSERPRTICVSTYGDSRDSRMEAEDTKYVMDELKKSEESLRSRTRSKTLSASFIEMDRDEEKLISLRFYSFREAVPQKNIVRAVDARVLEISLTQLPQKSSRKSDVQDILSYR